MNDRERILTLLNGGQPDRVPWFGDLTYWAGAMETRGEVPKGFQSTPAYYDFHRSLGVGFYLQGYHPFRTTFDETVRVQEWREGTSRFRVFETPAGTLAESWEYLPLSFTEAPREHMVKSPEDLPALRYLYEHTRYQPDYDEANRRVNLVADIGVVVCYLPKSPFMQMVAYDAGVEAVVTCAYEATDEFEETLRAMATKSDEAAGIALASPAECLMIPENLSSEMVGKELFEKYMRAWQEKWTARIRQAGKHSFIHIDGTLRGLLAEEGSVGFTVLEALTPAPVGDVPIEEWRSLAGPSPVLWGGVPGVYFSPLVSDAEFDRLVIEVLAVMRSEPRYVLGVADQVPPDGLESRVRRVVELVEEHGRY